MPRWGFTIIEAVMVLLIVATVVGALTPSVVRTISHARVNRAANVVQADLFMAQSLAGRQRQPVVVVLDASSKLISIQQPPPTNTVLVTRRYGLDSEFKLTTFTPSPASVVILPNGMANTSVTLTVGDGTYSRQITMSRVGQIRVL